MRFNVFGMNCSACASKVDKAVKNVVGVTECAVSLLTNSMTVEGTFNSQDVIDAVRKAGYKCEAFSDSVNSSKKQNFSQTSKILFRLIASFPFLIVLMYVSMGHIMWGWWLPSFMSGEIVIAIVESALALIVMAINARFFINGFRGIFHLAPNMDTLVSLGSLSSFCYSLVYFIYMQANGVDGYVHKLYFESAGMILVLVSVGKLLEAISKRKTTSALEQLKCLAPKFCTVVRDGKEMVIEVESVVVNDVVVVRPGESFSVDGIVKSGQTTVNEASLTGESIPQEKASGDKVYTATVNLTGVVLVECTKVGGDTNFAKIVKRVEEASTSKAPIAKIADKVSGVFVPVVLAIALFTICGYLIASNPIGYALERGVSVLVISCPCALGLATPVAIMVGNGVGARHGILFKNAEVLELAGKVKTIAFDKTGTLTKGQMSVADIMPCEFFTRKELLSFARAIESGSNHPIAQAIVKCGEQENAQKYSVTEFVEMAGNGVRAKIDGVYYYGGKQAFIKERCDVPKQTQELLESLSEQGKTVVLFCTDTDYLGSIAVSDSIKEDAIEAISELKRAGIKTVMLTGDNEKTAKAVASVVGVDQVFGGLLPEEKGEIISQLQREGKIAMVGDGINDALALTVADVGIAVGTGTDVAIESGDVVVMNDSLIDVCNAIALSKKTLRVIRQNLFWAFIYNVVGVPLAIGAFIPLGFTISPMFCSLCMSISSVLVTLNALRLNLFKTRKKCKEKDIDTTFVFEVEGLMCKHCEKTIEQAISSALGNKKVVADYKTGSVEVICKQSDCNYIVSIIESKGYSVKGKKAE